MANATTRLAIEIEISQMRPRAIAALVSVAADFAASSLCVTRSPTVSESLPNGYNQSASIPVFLVEAGYEFEDLGKQDPRTPNILRRESGGVLRDKSDAQAFGEV